MNYKTFDDWFDELEGYSYRSERFWDDFEYASQTKDYPMIKKWLKTAWEIGYQTSESKFYGGTNND
jgi:hypothetical protein